VRSGFQCVCPSPLHCAFALCVHLHCVCIVCAFALCVHLHCVCPSPLHCCKEAAIHKGIRPGMAARRMRSTYKVFEVDLKNKLVFSD